MSTTPNASRIVIVGAIVALVGFAVAAILFLNGSAADSRIGLLFALIGPTILALLSLLKSDQAATSTNAVSSIAQALNGGFEARVRHATRMVAAETGTKADAMRASADAVTSAALSIDPPVAPDPPITATPVTKVG